ncbi:Rad4-domain-containing protein [Xylariaceae sp. FL0804]|nr:Rad4-domain-containing protein [Xylariaceae sp. FL0804]
MPPIVPRKRLRTPSPAPPQSTRSRGKPTQGTTAPARKATLFDDLDSGAKKGSAEKTKAALRQMLDDDNDDDGSSLSSLSDADFEDVPANKRQKGNQANAESDEDEDEEDMEFEDVPAQEHQLESQPVLEDLELTLHTDNRVLLASELGKKGPSKREKAIRVSTHCIHVQFLLWHNAVRNSWLCDQEVQAIMISHLPPRLWDEVDRWKRNSGLEAPADPPKPVAKGKGKAKGKGRQAASKPTRDWGKAAERLEEGVPDMSHGDPLFRLMKCLLSWWKQRFRVTAPGLRKWGYMNARTLGKLRSAYNEEDHDPERFGERIRGLQDFRKHAQGCFGSRDVGAQLFTALLRGLGLEARMVANIQSLGFGWSKIEEADDTNSNQNGLANGDGPNKPTPKTKPSKKRAIPSKLASRGRRKSDRNALKMELDDSDEYADPVSEDSGDDSSVVEITHGVYAKRPDAKPYDKDLEYPHYWTEVLSPLTKKYLPVDSVVKSVVASSRELVESLEPRGGKAEKSKQIMAYCIGFSQDGTAKDVTVRYLRKQLFPGKTKGVRMSEEKMPIYNKHGKIKRYDRFDWFRSALRGYVRGDRDHPLDEVDELEQSTDLKPAQPQKKEVKEGEETLQYYKSSKDYVLERHLKREEALLPAAKPVKVFRNKGKGSKIEEEDVYLRKDVVAVKSAETWHKQGRAPVEGAQPLKHAPYRAATTNRRREIAEAEAATGQKVLQPLYSHEQTDWIIPPPIENGVIPKNEYGNIDMFAEHMCPEGAVHVPFRGGVRVCKRLEIDYAEAVVGFEFGHRMAVPVIQGVVIAAENHERMVAELEKDEAERARKEDEKRRKAALGSWRRFLMGLRIADRIRQDYGDADERVDVDVFGHHHDRGGGNNGVADNKSGGEEDLAGGFLPEGYEEEEEATEPPKPQMKEERPQTSGFFPPAAHGDEDGDEEGDDPFEVEFGQKGEETMAQAILEEAEPQPESEEEEEEEDEESEPAHEKMPRKAAPKRAAPKKAVPKAKAKPRAGTRQSARRRTRKKLVESSDEDDDDDDDKFMLDNSDTD